MKFTFIFSLLLLISSCTYCQAWKELEDQAITFLSRSDYKKAMPLLKKAIEAAQKELSETDEEYIGLVGTIAFAYKKNGQYDLAEAYYKQKIGIEKKLPQENDPGLAVTIKNLAGLYRLKGQNIKAEDYYKQSLEAYRTSVGEHDINFANGLNNLALFYKQTGYYEKAEPLYIRAKEIAEEMPDDHLLDYSLYLFNLGELYSETGQYGQAEPLLLEAENIRRELLGPTDPDYTIVLNNLATLYTNMGLYDKAILLQEQAITFMSMTGDVDSLDYAVSLNNLAGVYSLSGNYHMAEPFLSEANRIKKKYLKKTDISYIAGLQNHADLYALKQKFNEAEKMYNLVLNNFKATSDTANAYYAATLDAMGSLYKDMGKFEKSELYYKRAKVIRKKIFSDKHPEYQKSLNNLAYLYLQGEQYAKAEPVMMEESRIFLQNTPNTLFVLSEKEKNDYISASLPVLFSQNSYLYKFPAASPRIQKNNFQSHLYLKSLSLTQTRSLLQALQRSQDSTVRDMYEEWLNKKKYLAEQYSLQLSGRDPDLKYTEAQAEKLEKKLGRSLPGFIEQQTKTLARQEDIQNKLEINEAAIEFVNFRLYNKGWTDTTIYAAYVLRKTDSVPAFVVLCEEKRLEKYFSNTTGSAGIKSLYRSEVIDETAANAFDGDSLYSLIWKPLEIHLRGINKINYSPAGLLHRVAFHALPTANERVLSDKYELNNYISSRQLIAQEDEKNKKEISIALFGDASFTIDHPSAINDTALTKNATPSPMPAAGSREPWQDLPGTAAEINEIRSLVEANKVSATLYSQQKATEEQFGSLSGTSPTILHLATHGFFLPDPEVKRKKGFGEDNRNAFTQADNPMLRSGIILAGANRVWSGKAPMEGKEDGIVSAYEIAQLDLGNTDLVVLSACETALGDIKGTEGVFGLQRAFKLAGVKSMLLSLWKVPDKETAELMTAFYKYYLEGMPARAALNNAQKEMRKKYKPYYWAAFVLIE